MQAKACLQFAAFAVLLLAFAVRAENLPFKSYTKSEGLAHDRVNRIVRDSHEFLWFCTAEGLSRFDGYEFKNYTQDDGLPHRAIYDFLETRSGDFWVATGDGVVLFNPLGTSKNSTNPKSQILNSTTRRCFACFAPPICNWNKKPGWSQTCSKTVTGASGSAAAAAQLDERAAGGGRRADLRRVGLWFSRIRAASRFAS